MKPNLQDQSTPSTHPATLTRGITLTSIANQFLDVILGVSQSDVLNDGVLNPPVENPAQVLMLTANAMRSETIDPNMGQLDYRKLSQSQTYSSFRALARSLPHFTIEEIGDRHHQVAFWINIYNALILDAIIH